MTDDTIETKSAEQTKSPFHQIAQGDLGVVEKTINPEPEPEPVDAKTKLRDFEDKIIGKDAARIDGKIERGHGSKFQSLSEAEKREHAALEHVVDAEHKLMTATHELSKAQAHHATVSAAADRHGHK